MHELSVSIAMILSLLTGTLNDLTDYLKTLEGADVLAKEEQIAVVSAYTSLKELTDDTPFITASGTTTRQGIIANNCHPFGTKVKLGEEIYDIQDRMNRRYGCNHFDVWFPTLQEAKNYGVKNEVFIIIK